MKTIKTFKAMGVYGHLRMDLTLNDKLTFLYGLNGSGKTTALKLIMALLEPSLETLARIPFKKLELHGTTHSHGDITVAATKNYNSDLVLSFTNASNEVFSITIENSEVDKNDIQDRETRHHPVISTLSDITPPIFLGIDRRFKTPGLLPSRRLSPSARRMAYDYQHEQKIQDPSFDPVLGEVAFIIEDFRRSLRREQFQIDDQFRKQILLDSFVYSEPEFYKHADRPSKEMIRTLKSKREAIMQTLKRLNLASDELEKRSEEFFDKVENINSEFEKYVVKKHQQEEPPQEFLNALTAWFINKSQVDRIDSLFELASKYQAKQETILRPFNNFIELANKFFNQIGKEVAFDQAGDVEILLNKKPSTLYELSSGERQIFTMLAHLSLNRNLRKDGVFMVDEPELSLHMAWQDMFVEAVEAANPNLQIILATHAPAIIGGRDSLCIPVSSVEVEENDPD